MVVYIAFNEDKLQKLILNGDVEKVREYLTRWSGDIKENVNCPSDGFTALHNAVGKYNLPMVALLIELGADPNAKNTSLSPLHIAVITIESESESDLDASDATLHTSMYQYLVSHGADVNAKDSNGDTPLHCATGIAKVVAMKELLSHGADVNVKNEEGNTPLHVAAILGNEVTIKELLSSKQCNIEAWDKEQKSPLHVAVYHNQPMAVCILIAKGADLMCKDIDQRIPLHYACAKGSFNLVKLLIDLALVKDNKLVETMLKTTDYEDNMPLHLAVENRALAVAKLCLENGANVDAAQHSKQTALHLAAVAGELELFELLVVHKASVDVADSMGQSPLHIAVDYDHYEIINFLLEKGADINNCDAMNYSPLSLAAMKGNLETINMLLRHGAKEDDVRNALSLCDKKENLDAFLVLLNHDSASWLPLQTDKEGNTLLHSTAQNGCLPIVEQILYRDYDILAKNLKGQTALHLAARNGKIDVVCELVRREKAVVNQKDNESNTALHLAARAGYNKVVKQLIDSGANINARNTSDMRPLDFAAEEGRHETVTLLLKRYATWPYPCTKLSDSALLLACSRGHTEVVKQLISIQCVRQTDENGCNCLERAVDGGHKDVVMEIINSEYWEDALRNETKYYGGPIQTPMRKLIKFMPDAAERVFSKCTTKSKLEPDHQYDSITYNYEFLDDMYCDWSKDGVSCSDKCYDETNRVKPNQKPYTDNSNVLKDNHPLMIMVKENQKDLLQHELVTSLREHKWNSFARYFYYGNLLFFCLYLTFVTGYILVAKPPYLYYDQIQNASSQLSNCEELRPFYEVSSSFEKWLFIDFGKYVVFITVGYIVARESFQMFNLGLNYFGWENLIEWLICITSFLFVIDLDGCQQSTGIRTDWQWQLGSIAIFFSWLELVLFLWKLPLFGIYVVMFTYVLRSFVYFMPILLLFIVAFALSFHSLFQTQDSFQNFWKSFMKTTVMMIGELEYENTFYPGNPRKMMYNYVSYVIFAIFLIVMSITIMNLLGGLAVYDIQAIKRQAELRRLAMQVEHVLEVERIIPQFVSRRWVRRCRVICPNQQFHSCRPINWCRNLYRSMTSSTAITKPLNPELYEIKQLKESQEKMNCNITLLTQQMTALLKHHKVEFNDEDQAHSD